VVALFQAVLGAPIGAAAALPVLLLEMDLRAAVPEAAAAVSAVPVVRVPVVVAVPAARVTARLPGVPVAQRVYNPVSEELFHFLTLF
jgi:hypothetical protein